MCLAVGVPAWSLSFKLLVNNDKKRDWMEGAVLELCHLLDEVCHNGRRAHGVPPRVAQARQAHRGAACCRAMAEIHLLCGLPGSGKSTWAAARVREGAVVFNPDEWMLRLFGPHMPREVFDARLAACLELIYEQTVRLSSLGLEVVVDAGYWTCAQRRGAAARLGSCGATLTLRWFDVPIGELRRRLALRNAARPPNTFEITDEMLALFAGWFQPPTPAEGLRLVVERVG